MSKFIMYVMADPTVTEVLNIENKKEVERKFPLPAIVLVFLVFSPLAFILMWADSTYHKNFKTLLIVFGVILSFVALGNFITIEKLTDFYRETGSQFSTSLPHAVNSLLLLLGLGQIVFGFIYKANSKIHVNIAATILIFVHVLIGLIVGLLVFSIILPIYSLTSAF